jgi:hypothetical protein
MPGLQTLLGQLNTAFSKQGIMSLVEKREMFAPGKPFAPGIIVRPEQAVQPHWKEYLESIPVSMQLVIQQIIHHALGTKPPTQVTFAWAPSYDYELHIWHAPDAKVTKGGITVLVKSRYPDDAHPLGKAGGTD